MPLSATAAIDGPSAGVRVASWRREWMRLTLFGAAGVTAVDAFLLQESKAFFTGGFLSVNHASTPVEIAGFLAASLVADFAVLGVLVALVLWPLSATRLKPHALRLAVLSLALSPLVVADFVKFRLLSHLGDAFDLGLMFDLAGGDAAELAAVSAGQLATPALLMTGTVVMAGAIVWAVNRYSRPAARPIRRAHAKLALFAAALFVIGLVVVGTVSAANEVLDNGLRRKPSGHFLEIVTKRVTDLDGDGFGIGGLLADPDPFDSRIFPYAIDRPGNGLDENGLGGDLPASLPPYTEAAPAGEGWRRRPDVVFIMLESFRADAVGAVLGGRPVTPVLDALARRGVSSAQAFSHNGYTAHSRFHVFTGSLAGVSDGRSLVDDFKAQGYEVAYFSGQDESFGGPQLGVGFDRADLAYDARQDRQRRYTTFTTPGSLAVPHATVHERIATFMASRDAARPLFLYVNFHDTHYPYHHDGIRPLLSNHTLPESAIVPSRARELADMYLNTAANVDAAVGALLNVVRSRLARPPAVIVTADHGESLFDEHFLGHGYALNDVQTRVPFIVSGLPLVIEEPFGHVELRGAIHSALADQGDDTEPRITHGAEKAVFQYLGNLSRPRQIAFASGTTRFIYDLRSSRVRPEGSNWVRPNELSPPHHARFLELLNLWERMMVAREASAGRSLDLP